MIHAVRALQFAVFFITIMHVDARGPWWWLYVGVCAAEMLNAMLDTYLKRSSRSDQRGIPHGEYCLHVFLSVIIGAVMALMLASTYHLASEPTLLARRELDVPPMFVLTGHLSILMGVLFCLFEGGGVILLSRKPKPIEAKA